MKVIRKNFPIFAVKKNQNILKGIPNKYRF